MKAKSFILKIQAIFCAFLLLAVMCPVKITNSHAGLFPKETTRNFNAEGGNYVYTNPLASTYKVSASWISVSRPNSYSFKITIPASNTAYSVKSSRWGYVDFQNKNGKNIYRVYINQDNPYITASVSKVSIGIMASRSDTFTFTYNCPFSVSSTNSNFSLCLNSDGYQLGNGGSYQEYGKVKVVSVYVNARGGVNTSGYKKNGTIKLNYKEKAIQTINVSQAPSFTQKSKYVCTDSKGGTINIGIPKNGEDKICVASNFNLPIAARINRKKLKFEYDKKPDEGCYASGTVYGNRHEELDDDKDWYQDEIGTFTISKDDGTMTLKCKNSNGNTVYYTYKLS